MQVYKPSGVKIEDSMFSTSRDSALSARQGLYIRNHILFLQQLMDDRGVHIVDNIKRASAVFDNDLSNPGALFNFNIVNVINTGHGVDHFILINKTQANGILNYSELFSDNGGLISLVVTTYTKNQMPYHNYNPRLLLTIKNTHVVIPNAHADYYVFPLIIRKDGYNDYSLMAQNMYINKIS